MAPPSFPSYQCHSYVAHDLKTGGADLVDRVINSMPGGVIEVDNVYGTDAGLLKLQVIVNEGMSRRAYEISGVAQILGRVPYQLDHFRCSHHGVAFLIDLEILVGNEIEQHGIQRRPTNLMGAVVAGPDQHVLGRLGEVAIILPVYEEQIDADGWWSSLQHVGYSEQERDTRPAVVGAQDRLGRVLR